MDLLGMREFVLCFENQVCPVTPLEFSRDGTIRFAPLQSCREISSSGIQVKAVLHFSLASQRFLCHGEMFCPSPDQFVFVKKSDVLQERRSEPRYEVPRIPGFVIETGFAKHKIPTTVTDISRNGVQFRTSVPLSPEKRYLIQMELTLSPHRDIVLFRQRTVPYEGYLDIRHWRKERDFHVYGAQMLSASPEHKMHIDEYVTGIERSLTALPR